MLQVPGVKAPEGIPGQAEGGGSVKVAVPLDLDAHDASLNCHILEAVPCILHDFAETEYGAEGIRTSVINARLEVGSGDIGEDIPLAEIKLGVPDVVLYQEGKVFRRL